jgi:hypothetical protein
MKVVSDDRRDDAVPHKVTLSPIYTPMATIKCDGRAQFRSQQARDFGKRRFPRTLTKCVRPIRKLSLQY